MLNFATMPKTELHVHLTGALPRQAMWQLVQKYAKSSIPDYASFLTHFSIHSFTDFLRTWVWKNSFFRALEDFTFAAEQVALHFKAQNILYAEVFFSPTWFMQRGFGLANLMQAIESGFSVCKPVALGGPEIKLIIDPGRDYGAANAAAILDSILGEPAWNHRIIGLGLGGREDSQSNVLFAPVFERARQAELNISVHAGETGSVQSIVQAVSLLGAKRIGHGLHLGDFSWESFSANTPQSMAAYLQSIPPELLTLLQEKKLSLEACPGSNMRLGLVKHLAQHPLRMWLECGFLVSVHTDDPLLFANSLEQEMQQLQKHIPLTNEQLLVLAQNSIESSWANEPTRQHLRKALQQWFMQQGSVA
jgi:adenosine deaminase